MTEITDRACTGTLSDLKYLKQSGRLRVVIDVEPEMANVVFNRLGGYPLPGESRWIGLATLELPKA